MTQDGAAKPGRRAYRWTTPLACVAVLTLFILQGQLSGPAHPSELNAPPALSPLALSSRPVAPEPAGIGSLLATTAPSAPRPATISGGWLDLTPYLTTAPSGRYLPASAYDAFDGYLLLFGGYTGSAVVADTWTYQKAKWTDISSLQTTTPGARYAASMAYDPKDNVTVLFGGYDSANGTVYGNTYIFANGTWSKLTLATHPSPRWRANLAYDSNDGYLVLFGGTDAAGTTIYSDTWKFVSNKWTDISSSVSGSPPGRYRATMAYDAADKELVLFGGCTSTTCPTSDTWVYSNLVWKLLTLSKAPVARVYMPMGYDDNQSAVILYGGALTSGGTALEDTWAFANNSWTNITSQVGTPPSWRGYASLVYDPVGQYMVLFGGQGTNTATFYSDTWTYGLKALIFLTVTPPVTDVRIATNISVQVLTGAKSLSYYYGGLPPGCASANQSWNVCTPTRSGAYTVRVLVNDTKGTSTPATFVLVVHDLPAVSGLTFTRSPVTVGVRTVINVTAVGGTGVFTYGYPRLPPGCSAFNTSLLACTPNRAGSFPVTAVVADEVGGRGNRTVTLTVVAAPTPQNFHAAPPAIDYGMTALLYANVTGGIAPYSYLWSALPYPCVAANVSPLACRPSALGNYSVGVKVSDVFGVSTTGTVSLTVNNVLRLGTTGVTPLFTDVGSKVTVYANATGGSMPYNYTFSGAPCAFPNKRIAACTPTAAGNFTIQVTITDAAGAFVQSVLSAISVAPSPTVTALVLTPGLLDIGQSTVVNAVIAGGTAPFTFTYTGLPAGCTGATAQTFTCSPTAPGKATVVVNAKDALGESASANATLLVNNALKIRAFTVSSDTVAPGSTVVLNVSIDPQHAGSPPLSYRYGGLPPGCATANKPSLSCAPTGTGSFRVSVTVTDAAGASAAQSAMLTVATPSTSSPTFLGLPPIAGYGLIGAIVVVVAAVGALAMRRRKRRSATEPEPESE